MYHATTRCIHLKGRKKAFSICGINVESLLTLPFPPVPSPSPKDREILICSENLITVIMYMPTSKRNAFASQSTQRLSDYTMCTLMSSCPSSITWHFSWPIPFPHLMQLQRDLWVWMFVKFQALFLCGNIRHLKSVAIFPRVKQTTLFSGSIWWITEWFIEKIN